MKKFLKIVAASVALGAGLVAQAQDIHFSQFYENSVLRNPALTGIFSGDLKAGINYREQWSAVSAVGRYTTLAGTVEGRVATNREVGDYMSFGLAAYSDKAGSINFVSQGIYPTIAYNKAVNDRHNSYLSLGFTAGYIYRTVDMSKMTFSSMYQGSSTELGPSGETAPFKSLSNYDIGTGISFNSSIDEENRSNFYLGVSAYHLNRPTQIFNGGYSTVKLPIKMQANAGINFNFSNAVSLALHANVSQQNPHTEAIFGGLLSFHGVTPGLPSIFTFSVGSMYRVGDAFIPVVKIDYSNVSLGVSHDATNSDLGSRVSGAGATEITLYIRTRFLHNINPGDGFRCPRFETQTGYPFNN
jgi:type IX secretion system PorP/SprF family membrane protein